MSFKTSNMENTNKELVVILPEGMENVPIRIIREEGVEELSIQVVSFSETRKHAIQMEKRHAFVWHQNSYERVSLDEIMWIEANGSYCTIYATRKRSFTLSYPLTRIEERLPTKLFIRIQRSYLVNIDHIKKMTGHSLVVGEKILKIGDSYKERVLNEFIFLGVHGTPTLEKRKRKKR